MRIALDIGHGGNPPKGDPGAVGLKSKEKDVALAVGLLLKQALVKKGHKVVMTRGNDSFVELGMRCKIANNFKADLFISIHLNASANKAANGTETLYKTQKGKDIGTKIQKALVAALKTKDRGLKFRDDLYVLNGTNMTAVLVEIGFISNTSDLRLMLTKQKEIAGAIANAI